MAESEAKLWIQFRELDDYIIILLCEELSSLSSTQTSHPPPPTTKSSVILFELLKINEIQLQIIFTQESGE